MERSQYSAVPPRRLFNPQMRRSAQQMAA